MIAKKKSIKEQMIEDKINIPVIKEKEISIKPFIEKGHIFEKEVTTKWLINFSVIPELIIEQYRKYENWFNRSFNNKDTHFLAIEELDTYTNDNLEIFGSDK